MAIGSRVAASAALAFVSLAVLALAAAHESAARDTVGAEQISRLAGRWAGVASMVPSTGPSRSYRCVVTYRTGEDASQLVQKLRCSSESGYKLEAATELRISGAEVTGKWEDPVNAIGGDVRGVVTAGGFDVQLGGRFFQAKMQVNGSGCEQQVKLTPVKADYIRELSANLRKC